MIHAPELANMLPLLLALLVPLSLLAVATTGLLMLA